METGNFSTTFTYDNKGRLNTRTHPSGITETNNYNTHGYLASISAGGATRFTVTTMNARRQTTAATHGSNPGFPPLEEREGGFWIGGDAYTAVAVAKKEGTGSWTVYNIFRDHLGTITHLKTGSTITEYSFDAWGRRRDKDTWSYTLSSEPALFADRGFTAHEYLEDFKLYNMNGRLYDPVVARFLSPDPYLTDPSFTQSYNRYSYCLNNPLKFTDPSGYTWWGDFRNWVGNGFKNLGNWMTRNNIQVQVGVNISADGTVPFAGITGPNNFNVNTQNFVKQPTAAIQSIHQQIAMFSRMSTGVSPEWNMPMQQFVGESPLAGGVPSNSGGGLPSIDGQTGPWSPEYITEKTLEGLSNLYVDGAATALDVLGYTKGLSNLTTLISIANDSYLYFYNGNMNDIAYGKTNDMVYGYRLVTTGLAWGAGYYLGGPIGFTVGAYTKGIEKAAVEGTKMEYQLRNYLNPSKKGNFWSQFYW